MVFVASCLIYVFGCVRAEKFSCLLISWDYDINFVLVRERRARKKTTLSKKNGKIKKTRSDLVNDSIDQENSLLRRACSEANVLVDLKCFDYRSERGKNFKLLYPNRGNAMISLLSSTA